MIVYKTDEKSSQIGLSMMMLLTGMGNTQIMQMCKNCAREYNLKFDDDDTECEVILRTIKFESLSGLKTTGVDLVNFSIFDEEGDEWLIKIFAHENLIWFSNMDDVFNCLIEEGNLEDFIKKYNK